VTPWQAPGSESRKGWETQSRGLLHIEDKVMNRKQQPRISAKEVQNALHRFKSSGGLIQKLPDQPTPRRRMVGGKWAMYEPVLEGIHASVPATPE
jgi:hypothetical protein